MWLHKGFVNDPGNIIFIAFWMGSFTQVTTTGQGVTGWEGMMDEEHDKG